jgi:hypothetical protein
MTLTEFRNASVESFTESGIGYDPTWKSHGGALDKEAVAFKSNTSMATANHTAIMDIYQSPNPLVKLRTELHKKGVWHSTCRQ